MATTREPHAGPRLGARLGTPIVEPRAPHPTERTAYADRPHPGLVPEGRRTGRRTATGPGDGGRALRRAAGGLALLVGGLALFYAVVARPYLGDEAAHADYAYQVWHGRLPVFEEGLAFEPKVPVLPGHQWAAQHPPLFYLLLAPLVGPPAGDGKWLAALLLGRAASVGIALGALVAVGALAARVARSRRALWAVAAPTTVGLLTAPLTVAGTIYNDHLALLTVALALAVGCALLRGGVTRARVAAAGVVGAAGMATRGAFVATLALLLAAIVAADLLHGRGPRPARLRSGALAAAVVGGAALLPTAWFYARNRAQTGSLLGAREDYAASIGRVRRPPGEVASDPAFWAHYRRLFVLVWDPLDVRLGLAITAALAVTAVAGVLARRSWRRWTRCDVAVGALLAGQVGAVVAMQVLYVSRGGGMQVRYGLLALPVVALVLAAGVLAWPRITGALLPAVAAAYALIYLDQLQAWRYLVRGTTATRLSGAVCWVLLAVAVVGLLRFAGGTRDLARQSGLTGR